MLGLRHPTKSVGPCTLKRDTRTLDVMVWAVEVCEVKPVSTSKARSGSSATAFDRDGIAAKHSMLAAMRRPSYPRLWAVGLLISLARWMTIFLASYMVNDITHSAFLVQIVGVAIFTPLFAGGLLAGAISDRLDRHNTIGLVLLVLSAGAMVIAALLFSHHLSVWLIYPFVFGVGISHLIDMTSRRSLVYDSVGPNLITNALALESVAMMAGTTAGSLIAGSIITALGTSAVFVCLSALYALALFLVYGMATPQRLAPAEHNLDLLKDLREGLHYVGSQPALLSILGVTIVMNLFYFSFMPMVPIFGDRLHVNAFWSSFLLSGYGFGSIVGATGIARGLAIRRGWVYVGGCFVAMPSLFLFAAVGWYPAAFLLLFLAGVGISGFATMQSVLVMIGSNDAMRGRALGMLSMCIGALPFAMLMLGGAATAIGPPAAVMTSVGLGLVVLAAFLVVRPEAKNLA